MVKAIFQKMRFYFLLAGFVLAISGCGEEKKEVDSESVPYHIGMGKAFYQLGKYEKAIEMYRKSIALDALAADAYLQLAIIYDDNLQQKEKAVACYRKFLELEPDSEKAKWVRNWMAESKESLKRPSFRRPPPPVARRSPIARPAQKPEKVPSPVPPPKARITVMEASPEASTYTVKRGDTLVQIAHRIYGNRNEWHRIFESNRDILSSPHALRPGQVLKIPPARSKAIIEM